MLNLLTSHGTQILITLAGKQLLGLLNVGEKLAVVVGSLEQVL